MRMIYSDRGPSPFQPEKPGAAGERDSTFGWWGAFSVEKFATASPLRYTHEDASGFLAYLQQFYDRNFWFADAGVQVWAYEETFDNWQDRYGMDAVCAVYHSGHGDMDGNGVFYAPLGAAWDGRTDAVSTRMALGNEKARYIFWSTCFSLRVLGGHSPIRTWATPNLGFRMLFGFETTSIDNPDYGKKFWEKWRSGQTFCDAWLNASWDIWKNQAPSVVAVGATQAEAVNRLNTERTLFRDAVPDNWYAWRWYNARASLADDLTAAPESPQVIQLAPRDPSVELTRAGRVAEFPAAALEEAQVERQGVLSVSSGDRVASTGPHAVRWVRLAEPNHRNTTALPTDRAVELARAFAEQHADGAELIVDGVHDLMQNSGTKDGAETGAPVSLQTHVTFRQAFDGVPVITPDRGVIRVGLDNDGKVVQAQLSTRTATGESREPSALVVPPAGAGGTPAAPQSRDPQEALAAAQDQLLAELAVRGAGDGGDYPAAVAREQRPEVRDVPGSFQVGYEMVGNEAYLAARKLVEIGPEEGGYKTQRWVTAPLAR
ncbi:DUF6345 domain-containing protein [Streptomyces silvensis]|uniref:Uncharacterized protein n=1 Tax=Streptomyces silvensis TaxID=1765722 RepID=A0A0W7WVA9_9ACTN|nr:DUF6345 domain-containing protein [Streptomyces silvensis]KUF14505.1 hypothetical protein AT728_32110 [Streptomyces silvensis]